MHAGPLNTACGTVPQPIAITLRLGVHNSRRHEQDQVARAAPPEATVLAPLAAPPPPPTPLPTSRQAGGSKLTASQHRRCEKKTSIIGCV